MPDFGPGDGGHGGGRLRDDLVQPFQLDSATGGAPRLTGRLARLGPVVADVLDRHDYPEPVAELLGQALALSATLAGALKFDGIFTLQVQGDGPVSLLLADIETRDGGERYLVRGYAKYDSEAVAAHDGAANLLGSGYLALTVDQGPHTDRYQGMVELVGDTLAECAQHYFRQSQQMDAAITLSAGRTGGELAGSWRAAGMMVQRIADDPTPQPSSDDGDDAWRRVMMLMATGTDAEMLDPALSAERYLFRLFHEEGVRVSPARPVARGCRCSSERVYNVLIRLPDAELDDLAIDGHLEVTCEFCAETYRFGVAEVRQRIRDAASDSPDSPLD